MSGEARYYLDTCAVIPYYREEPLSSAVQDFLVSITPPVYISDLTGVEFVSALARLVRVGDLDGGSADSIAKAFADDIKANLFVKSLFASGHCKQAEKWLAVRNTSLRALDALHLAICKKQDACLVTCDKVFFQSARQLGVNALLIAG